MFHKNIFGARLKEQRAQRGVSQKNIADLLNVTVTQISDMEHGKVATTMSRLYVLCEYFNVSADYFLGLSNEPKGF